MRFSAAAKRAIPGQVIKTGQVPEHGRQPEILRGLRGENSGEAAGRNTRLHPVCCLPNTI